MLSEEIKTEIVQIIEERMPTAFLVDIKLQKGPQSSLTIKVDTDAGITMAECASLSRGIGHMMDEKDFFDFAYKLEVTSPGVGSPLKLLRQYHKNLGRYLKVKTENEEIKGKLEKVSEEEILLTPIPKKKSKKKKNKKKAEEVAEPSEYLIRLSDIIEAKVIII